MRNVAQVRTVLNDVIAAADGDVIVDMAGLEMIDAAGLGMLTAAHLRAQRAGHHLVLRNCSDDVRRVLAVTHLNRVSAHRPPLSLSGALHARWRRAVAIASHAPDAASAAR